MENLIATTTPNPFDIASIAGDPDYLDTAGTTVQITTVSKDKPKSESFFRLHPGPAFQDIFGTIKQPKPGQKIGHDFYVVLPNMFPALQGEFYRAKYFLGKTRQGDLFVWPIRMPEDDAKADYYNSCMLGVQAAMEGWVRLKWSGAGYNIIRAEGDLGEPRWPNLTFKEILQIAFNGEGIISSLNHPVVKARRGLV
jgi:hypothetical protein